ncbi:hypothetical protein P170DRAFT_509069 [Aspergillus steynii IBT 23096]|uniref:Uncharacterized protein n=1 Tax=Aspergillus steynii IBT 23096 TaxID=1392250 RepID=A0A2I2GDT1_9EURO|nr:uncharacterized protein P170DRAFT_509069 [Aspergillus steynii IBT 23096]PLB51022.1 hypothetical protein P170DRAFT_509069 [Aspergillus steynii IBT 23096]
MLPLHLRLENRYQDLAEIRESLWNLNGEDLTDDMAKLLRINFHHLDIDTGATSESVTPYFLPRKSFPSCRDTSGDLKDVLLDEGQNPENGKLDIPTCLTLTLHNYACGMNSERETHISYTKVVPYGWVKETSPDPEHLEPRPRHFYKPWLGYRYAPDTSVYQDELKRRNYRAPVPGMPYKRVLRLGDLIPSFLSLSHGMTEYDVHFCHDKLPSISEVLAAVDEILHSMRSQRDELQNKEFKQGSTAFNHILPRLILLRDSRGHRRLLYAYFDGSRLNVQFTELLHFEQFAVTPPPGTAYRDFINLSLYHDMIDQLLKWAWPVVQGDTSESCLRI